MKKTLCVSFDLTGTWQDDNDLIERVVGRSRDGSGAGFGKRDMEFGGIDADEAARLRVVLQQLDIPGLEVDVIDEDQDQDDE